MAAKNLSTVEILKKYWGYDSFRHLQSEIIDDILSGVDTLALMPTGGGKSITYQVPAMAMEGICLVVTPLISLMKDQVDALRKRGIRALTIHAGMTSREIDITLDNAVYGNYKFLYVSPERLSTSIFKSRFARMNVSMIAVDEAHCISSWGYDFRPAYLRIAEIRAMVPTAVLIAVTATATNIVVKDIMERLLFNSSNIRKMSFARNNLSYIVRTTEDKDKQLVRVVNNVSGSGIIYCRLRKECERIAELLKENGVAADFYHGGLSYQIRSVKQEAWISEKLRVIVATNAFGMGIDKANVRYVVHNEMPDTLEAYYQEAGRAGRDGEHSFAVLFNSTGDKVSAEKRIAAAFPPIDQIKYVYEMLCNYFQISIGEGEGIAHDFNIYDFCVKFKIFTTTVASSIKILQINEYMTITEEIDNPTRIMFIVSREDLYRIQLQRNDLERFIQILLRIYPGLFSEYVAIDEEYIAAMSGYTKMYIGEAFKKLGQLRMINYIPRKRTPLLIFNCERLPLDNLRITPESYSFRKERAEKRIESVVDFTSRKDKCRSLMLQHYFGEQTDTSCGKCDVCRASKDTSIDKGDREKILKVITNNEPIDIKDIVSKIKGDATIISSIVRRLILEAIVQQNVDGTVEVNKSMRV